jgi:hypothetical protein
MISGPSAGPPRPPSVCPTDRAHTLPVDPRASDLAPPIDVAHRLHSDLACLALPPFHHLIRLRRPLLIAAPSLHSPAPPTACHRSIGSFSWRLKTIGMAERTLQMTVQTIEMTDRNLKNV